MDASSAQVVATMMSASLPPSTGLPPVETDEQLEQEQRHEQASSTDLTRQQSQESAKSASQSRRYSDELEQLNRRLDRLVKPPSSSSSSVSPPIQPSQRKNSAGSHIPGPEATAKRSPPSNGAMSQSVRMPPPPKPTSPKDKTSTASMLRTTLRRMKKLTLSKDKVDPPPVTERARDRRGTAAAVISRRQNTSPNSVSRSRSFRASEQQRAGIMQQQAHAKGMSSSLRRPKNKDVATAGESKSSLPRSGTGTLERHQVSRSHSVQGKRTRDRVDLNVRKSRGVQTQLTRDVLADEDGTALEEGQVPLQTSLDFSLYMPGVLGSGGADDDQVETLLAEPTEPVDVRKNRQLTLDNMRLQREVERLKMQLSEGVKEREGLKREKRAMGNRLEDVQGRLKEEEALRLQLEQQMDRREEKMREIAMSMEHVEREFVNRDENILSLEARVQEYRSVVARLQAEADSAQDVITNLRGQLDRSMEKQKVLLQQLGEVEAEARELQEFLQAEKMTLSETLKDCEAEIAELKAR